MFLQYRSLIDELRAFTEYVASGSNRTAALARQVFSPDESFIVVFTDVSMSCAEMYQSGERFPVRVFESFG